MAKRWTVECIECGKKDSFADMYDISHAKWTVIAWMVPGGDPRCVCDECEYGKPRKKKK